MIVGYCRVSSREQSINTEALEQQKSRVAPHCDRLIVDVESGSSRSRPGFKEIEGLIRMGKVKRVICTRIDRLTRSLGQLQHFIELVGQYAVEVVCLDDNFDLTTATGRFHANIIGSVAEMETAMLSERIRHGWEYFRQQRKVHSPAFGYKVDAENKLVLDHDPFLCLIEQRQKLSRYDIARMLVNWYLNPPEDSRGRNRRSLRRTVELLNETFGLHHAPKKRSGRAPHGQLRFGTAGLSDWLSSPTVRGHTVYLKKKNGRRLPKEQWQIIKNTHPPLFTESEASQIDAFKKTNRYHGKNKRQFPASGLVRCARCGDTCYLKSGTRGKTQGRNYYYQCHRWNICACDQKKMIRVENVESAIIDALVGQAGTIAQSYEISVQENEPLPPKILELQASLDALEKLPYNPAIEQTKAAINEQIKMSYASLKDNKDAQSQRQNQLIHLGDRQRWNAMDIEEKMRLFHYFIKAVWLEDGAVVGIDFF